MSQIPEIPVRAEAEDTPTELRITPSYIMFTLPNQTPEILKAEDILKDRNPELVLQYAQLLALDHLAQSQSAMAESMCKVAEATEKMVAAGSQINIGEQMKQAGDIASDVLKGLGIQNPKTPQG